MNDIETKRYRVLNDIAEQHGIIIFGSTKDKEIPLCELRQAFSIESLLYNRSVANLSICDAISAFDEFIAPLDPEMILLHIGEADLEFFENSPYDFDQKYRELITHIRTFNKKCRIVIISLKNYDKNKTILDLNKHLKYIAESEQCEYEDINIKRVWNPKETKDVISFVYSLGFVRPLKNKRPVYDLVKILFCYEA